ncbi:hypothetical protein NKI66_19475 [Mesorhizobium sp. M0518]
MSLELLAAGRFFDRLMDNSKVVRYLARNFPGHLKSSRLVDAASKLSGLV